MKGKVRQDRFHHRMLIAVGMAIVLVLLPYPGRAHTLGLSVAQFEITAEDTVEARVTFASTEPLGGTPLRGEDLGAFMAQGIGVTADGVPCDGTFLGSSITEMDGLQLDARYACPKDAARIEVTLYYLSRLSPRHREVARIEAPGASIEAILTGDRRALGLTIPGRPAHARAAIGRHWLLVGIGCIAALATIVMVRRRRA